jgi:hypothetical protein
MKRDKRVLLLIEARCSAVTRLAQAQVCLVQRKAGLALLLALCMLGLSATAYPQKITVFDAAGAGAGASQGTLGVAISPSGAIAGFDFDGNGVSHGFLRSRSGVVVTFDAPAQAPARAKALSAGASTRRARSQDSILMRAVRLMASCAVRTVISRRTMLLGRVQDPAKARTARALMRRERSPGNIRTRVGCFMVSFGPQAVPSLPLTLSAPALVPARARSSQPSQGLLRRGRSPDTTLTAALWRTGTCALPAAPSLPSTLRVRAQAPPRAPMLEASTQRAKSRPSS